MDRTAIKRIAALVLNLTPVAGEVEFADPAMVGEWAEALAGAIAVPQIPPWCSYMAREARTPVGMAAFKGAPDEGGWAEIAYLTFISAQGRGVATGMAACLEGIARDHRVAGLCAHTLPEENASTKVLIANGFARVREIMDPEDGVVWRWEKALVAEDKR